MPTLRDPAAAAEQVRVALGHVQRRLWIRHVLRAVMAGAAATAVVFAISIPVRARLPVRSAVAIAAGSLAVAIALARVRRERSREGAAASLERAYPSLRNLAVTAA